MRRHLLHPTHEAPRLAALILLALTTQTTQAELIAYDPFRVGTLTTLAPDEYLPGPLVGQNPLIGSPIAPFFEGPWLGGIVDEAIHIVQPTGLDYRGRIVEGGSVSTQSSEQLQNGRVGRKLASPWDDATEGIFYIGLLADFGAGNLQPGVDASEMGYRALELWQPDTGFQDSGKVIELGYSQFGNFSITTSPAQQFPATARLAVRVLGGVTHIFPDAPASYNEDRETHLIVMRFDLSAEPAADRLSFYLDPTTEVEPALPSVEVDGVDFSLGMLGTVSRFGGELETNPAFDEFRVGTEFADVVPGFPTGGVCPSDGTECLEAIKQNFSKSDISLGDGDLSGDGRVSLADFRIWKDNRLPIDQTAIAILSVPEPSTIALMLLAALCFAGGKR